MLDERIVIALSGSDLVGRNVQPLQPVCRGPRKWSREIDHSQGLYFALEFRVLLFRERTALHDVPYALFRISRDDIIGNHLVVNDVRLKLYTLTSDTSRLFDHPHCFIEASLVVDADLGDHQRRMRSADGA